MWRRCWWGTRRRRNKYCRTRMKYVVLLIVNVDIRYVEASKLAVLSYIGGIYSISMDHVVITHRGRNHVPTTGATIFIEDTPCIGGE